MRDQDGHGVGESRGGSELQYLLSSYREIRHAYGREFGKPCPFMMRAVVGDDNRIVAKGMLIVFKSGDQACRQVADLGQEKLDVRLTAGNLRLFIMRDDEVPTALRFYLMEELATGEFKLVVARMLNFPKGTYISSQYEEFVDLIPDSDDPEEEATAYRVDEEWRRERGLPVTMTESSPTKAGE